MFHQHVHYQKQNCEHQLLQTSYLRLRQDKFQIIAYLVDTVVTISPNANKSSDADFKIFNYLAMQWVSSSIYK